MLVCWIYIPAGVAVCNTVTFSILLVLLQVKDYIFPLFGTKGAVNRPSTQRNGGRKRKYIPLPTNIHDTLMHED